MRSKWEEGVRLNLERRDFLESLLKTWVERGGWETDPEYMHSLEQGIKRQNQYLKNRCGLDA
jgi:hypothetical protein